MAIRTHPVLRHRPRKPRRHLRQALPARPTTRRCRSTRRTPSAQKKLALIRDLMGTGSRPGKTIKPIGDARPTNRSRWPKHRSPSSAPAAPRRPPRWQPPGCGRRACRGTRSPWRPNPPRSGRTRQTRRRKARRRTRHREVTRRSTCGPPPGRARTSRPTSAPMRATSRHRRANRAAWDAERQKRIDKPGAIQVSYENLRVSVDGDTAPQNSASTTSRQRSRRRATRYCNGQARRQVADPAGAGRHLMKRMLRSRTVVAGCSLLLATGLAEAAGKAPKHIKKHASGQRSRPATRTPVRSPCWPRCSMPSRPTSSTWPCSRPKCWSRPTPISASRTWSRATCCWRAHDR
jgi:hypothetical protein